MKVWFFWRKHFVEGFINFSKTIGGLEEAMNSKIPIEVPISGQDQLRGLWNWIVMLQWELCLCSSIFLGLKREFGVCSFKKGDYQCPCPSRSKSYIVNNQLGKQSWFECDCWKWLSVMYWYFEGSKVQRIGSRGNWLILFLKLFNLLALLIFFYLAS